MPFQMEPPKAGALRKISNTGAGAGPVKLFVWSVRAIMTAATLAYVVHFGRDVPYWDEWDMVAVITKAQPVTLEWLWSSHNGHRIPLPRLLLLSLYKLSGTDFRAGMYFNVILSSAAAAALIWGSGRMRGAKNSVVDAIFPVLLLHWGHYENLLWSWQVTQILPVAIACVVLAVIAAYGLTPVPSAAAFAAVLITMLPMSGMTGLAYVPALVSWLVAVGWIRVRLSRIIFAAAIWASA